MNAVTSLFSGLKELFGKTFVLVGLLPSAVILFGWNLYNSEMLDIAILFQDEATPILGPTVIVVGWLLGMGIVFYAFHLPIFEMFRSLPAPPFYGIRGRFLKSQRYRWRLLERESERADWDLTASSWGSEEHDFAPAAFNMPWVSVPTLADALCASAKARTTLEALALKIKKKVVVPSEKTREIVVDGLRQLREVSVSSYGEKKFAVEIQAWRNLLDPDTNRSLETIQDIVETKSASAYNASKKYPASLTWVLPTVFGNRTAALDDYAEQRYGISTGVLWSRLADVIEAEQRDPVAQAQLNVYIYTNLSAALGCLAVAIGLHVAIETAVFLGELISAWVNSQGSFTSMYDFDLSVVDVRATIALILSAGFSRVFYVSAITAFDTVREKIISLVDFNRRVLLEKMDFATPKEVDDEKALFEDLHRFFVQAMPLRQRWRRKGEPEREEKEAKDKKEKEKTNWMSMKLDEVRVDELMKSLDASTDEMIVLRKDPADVRLGEMLTSCESATHVLLLTDEGEPRHIVPRGVIAWFVAQRSEDCMDITLEDMFEAFPFVAQMSSASFDTVESGATVSVAQKKIYPHSIAVDIVVTKDGSRSSQALGLLSNVDIARLVRT